MDTLTQILLGAAVGEAVGAKRLGRPAMIFGGLCGLVPDLDVLLAADPWRSLVVHRAESHSLVVLPVVALVMGLAAWWLTRRRAPPGAWLQVALWSLVTHPLLDWFTTYGTQLLAPVSDHRFALDGVAIVDLVYTLPLAWVVWRASRLRVGVERRVRSARWVLAATTAYLFVGLALSQWAVARADTQLRQAGFEPVQLRAPNTFFNALAHRIVAVDAEGHSVVGITSALAPSTPIVFSRFEWPVGHPALEAVLAHEHGRLLQWFSGGYLRAEVAPREGGGHAVRLIDLKYGSVEQLDVSIFGGEFLVDATGHVERSERTRRPSGVDYGRELGALAAAIGGGQAEPPEGAARLVGVP